MKHALKRTLAAMLLVPALGLGAAGVQAAAYGSGTDAANPAAAEPTARPNKADTRSIVEHSQAMGMPPKPAGAAQAAPAMGDSGRSDSTGMRSDSTRTAAATAMSQGSTAGNMAGSGSSDPLMDIFDALDTNKDGKLSRAEVAHDANLAKQMRALDRDHDGSLSREEFTGYKR